MISTENGNVEFEFGVLIEDWLTAATQHWSVEFTQFDRLGTKQSQINHYIMLVKQIWNSCWYDPIYGQMSALLYGRKFKRTSIARG